MFHIHIYVCIILYNINEYLELFIIEMQNRDFESHMYIHARCME